MSPKRKGSTIRFTCFPQTAPPPDFVPRIIGVFQKHEGAIATRDSKTGLKSDQLLDILRGDLEALGFEVEKSKKDKDRIIRPVFFGEDGKPIKTYSVDAFHAEWRCGLEIEAGRAIGGNAIYRDLVQSLVMVHLDHLCLAVANAYRYGHSTETHDYETTLNVATALYGHSRMKMPYGLTVIGY